MEAHKFPAHFFLLYILFYSGQAMYGVYFNLYLSNIGFSNTMIGLLTALSTLLLLMAQPFWGVMSDRAKKKNTILKLLFLLSGLSALLYYRSTDYLYVVIINLIFTMFYSTLVPLQDNITLEYLAGTRWDFGKIRMGDYRLCYHCRNSRNPDKEPVLSYILGCFAFYAALFYSDVHHSARSGLQNQNRKGSVQCHNKE